MTLRKQGRFSVQRFSMSVEGLKEWLDSKRNFGPIGNVIVDSGFKGTSGLTRVIRPAGAR